MRHTGATGGSEGVSARTVQARAGPVGRAGPSSERRDLRPWDGAAHSSSPAAVSGAPGGDGVFSATGTTTGVNDPAAGLTESTVPHHTATHRDRRPHASPASCAPRSLRSLRCSVPRALAAPGGRRRLARHGTRRATLPTTTGPTVVQSVPYRGQRARDRGGALAGRRRAATGERTLPSDGQGPADGPSAVQPGAVVGGSPPAERAVSRVSDYRTGAVRVRRPGAVRVRRPRLRVHRRTTHVAPAT